MRLPSRLVRTTVALAALLAAAGCGGAGLDYGTASINTAACTGLTLALYSPTGTSVAPAQTQIIISVAPATSGLAETPGNYELLLQTAVGASTITLGTVTAIATPSGAPAGTYLSASIPAANQPLASNTVYDVTLYNPSSTCSDSSFASFTTS